MPRTVATPGLLLLCALVSVLLVAPAEAQVWGGSVFKTKDAGVSFTTGGGTPAGSFSVTSIGSPAGPSDLTNGYKWGGQQFSYVADVLDVGRPIVLDWSLSRPVLDFGPNPLFLSSSLDLFLLGTPTMIPLGMSLNTFTLPLPQASGLELMFQAVVLDPTNPTQVKGTSIGPGVVQGPGPANLNQEFRFEFMPTAAGDQVHLVLPNSATSTLESVVPEPGSIGLMMTGLAGLVPWVLRRRKR